MYCPENKVKIISKEHLKEVWQTGHWYLNQIHADHVVVSNYRPDIKFYHDTFWFTCPLDMFFSLEETTKVTTLIFHMSRCGSTLFRNLMNVNQMCLNEPFFFNQSVLIKDQNLRNYTNRINNINSNIMIKTSSWNIMQLDWIKKMFPTAKTIFICRAPLEVLASFYMKPTGWINSKEILAQFEKLPNDQLIKFALCLEQLMIRAFYTDQILSYDKIVNESIYGNLANFLEYHVNEEKMLEVSKINSKTADEFKNDYEEKAKLAEVVKQIVPKEIINRLEKLYTEMNSDLSYIR